jgi:hypothetical protein
MGTRGSFSMDKNSLDRRVTTHFHLLLRLKMHEGITAVPMSLHDIHGDA